MKSNIQGCGPHTGPGGGWMRLSSTFGGREKRYSQYNVLRWRCTIFEPLLVGVKSVIYSQYNVLRLRYTIFEPRYDGGSTFPLKRFQNDGAP